MRIRVHALLAGLAIAAVLALILPAAASAAPWRSLAAASLDPAASKEELAVQAEPGMRHLVLEVRKAGLVVKGLSLHLAGGEVVDLKFYQRLAAGERSRVVALPTDRGAVEKITLRYAASSGPDRPVELTLLGKS